MEIWKKYSLLYLRDQDSVIKNIDNWLIDNFKSVIFAFEQASIKELIKVNNIRIVIIDLDYKFEYINVARYLKNFPSQIYVLAINGYSNSDNIIEAINSGFFDKFIIKPFKRSSLAELLKDIIHLLEQEEALKLSEERLSLALDGTRDGLWDWNIKDDTFFFSNRLLEILGYGKDELKNNFESFKYICHPNDFYKALKLTKESINDKADNYSIEHRAVKKNGQIIWVLNRGKTVFDKDKNPIRMVGYITDITEQKNILSGFMLSKFSNDNSSEEVIWIRKDGSFEYVNESSCRYLGYTKDELIKKSIYDIDPQPRHHPDNFDATWNYLKRKKFVNFTSHQVRKDGSMFPVDVYASLFEFEDREYIFVFGRDITKRIKIENSLKESEAKFRDMFEYHSAVMLLIDPIKYKIIDGNNSALNFYGYSKTEFQNLPLFNISFFDEKSVKSNIAKILDKKNYTFISKHILKSGEIRDVEVHTTPISINEKETLFSIIHDISDRIAMQEALKKQSEFLQTLIDTLPIPFFFKDEKLIYRLHNKAFSEFLGVKDIKGKRAEEVFDIQTATICDRIDTELISESLIDTKRYEYKVLHKDGTFHDVILYKSLIYFDNSTKGVIGAILDISDLKRVEDALFEKTKQLKELNKNLEDRVVIEVEKQREQEQMLVQQSKMAQMGEMIGNIAHQWKQPLNTIGLLIQDIEDAFEYNELDSDSMAEFVYKSTQQIEFMSKTITDFRNFFKPSKVKSKFSITKACQDVLIIIESQLRSTEITIRFDKEPNLDDMVETFENELKQVVLNLFTNSKDAIVSENIKNGEIYVYIKKVKKFIVIEISDNGKGIKKDILEKIFKPYISSKGEKGTGIGLYMSKMIVEKSMNGKLTAENSINGAKFSIYLPIS